MEKEVETTGYEPLREVQTVVGGEGGRAVCQGWEGRAISYFVFIALEPRVE